jgi:hypothetical protein
MFTTPFSGTLKLCPPEILDVFSPKENEEKITVTKRIATWL